jgi:hypothetical protein
LSRVDATTSTQARIAVDEARHADLGWDVLAFALARGDNEVRDTVRDLRHERAGFTRAGARGDERWGQLERAHAEETNTELTQAARRRLDALL